MRFTFSTRRAPHGLVLISVLASGLFVSNGFAATTAKSKPKVTAKPKPKPKPAVAPKKPTIGIKGAPQMTGAVGRFGELYGLKSGWTFEVLSARYSYEPFDDYNGNYAETGKKLLVLQVAIKNNTKDDLFFNGDAHSFQVQDENNELHSSIGYRLKSKGSSETSLNLKPGQGAGQDASNPLEIGILVPEKAQVTKIILQNGREGSKEDVIRYFVAGTQGGDAKNIISPLPAVQTSAEPLKIDGYFPSANYHFKINSVQFVDGPVAGNDPPENRRWAVVNFTVQNPTTKPQSVFDFAADSSSNVYFTDEDGEHYTVNGDVGVLKGTRDEAAEGDIAPGQEKTLRFAFAVPKDGTLKTLVFGANRGKYWTFDASGWK